MDERLEYKNLKKTLAVRICVMQGPKLNVVLSTEDAGSDILFMKLYIASNKDYRVIYPTYTKKFLSENVCVEIDLINDNFL